VKVQRINHADLRVVARLVIVDESTSRWVNPAGDVLELVPGGEYVIAPMDVLLQLNAKLRVAIETATELAKELPRGRRERALERIRGQADEVAESTRRPD
jgi:hypothetical protein